MKTAPPLFQEMIMGQTREKVKEEMKKEVMPEAKKEVRKGICDVLPHLVPEIMQDIITSMTEHGRMRRDFREKYKNLDSDIVECAILTAIAAVSQMEVYYVHRAFTLVDPAINDYSDVENDSDGMYY